MTAATSPEARFNPFPGLRPFRSDENHLFFGRDEQVTALLRLLRSDRFLAVIGASGSGKSSLVRAGLIPELHGGTMARAGSTWEVVILRPGGRPVENLARALLDADLYDRDDPDTLPRLRATLGRSRFGIVEAVKQSDALEPDTNLLVVVDQFEELFRFRHQGTDSEEAATAFVNLLLTASDQEEHPIYVTLTMRSDYLGDCAEIPGLAEMVNRGEYLIPRLMRDQKRAAIEMPIGVGGARISPMLVQRLLNDIGDDPDQLPVLQHALMRMWDVWSAGGDRERPIDFCDLDATGGLTHALSRHADEIYDALPDEDHRVACERVFKTLTEKGADNRGIRRPTRLERLEAIAASDRATITRVLDAFRRPGVTFVMPGIDAPLSERTVIDLSHESLMRGWHRLRGWVEEEAQSARIFHRLSETASLWRDGKAGLFRDPDLQIALSWRDDEGPNDAWAAQYGGQLDAAIAFLEASRSEAKAEEEARETARQRELEQARTIAEVERRQADEQRRSARRLKWLACGLAGVVAVAVAASIFALAARRDAREKELLAKNLAAETEIARRKLREQLYVADMNRVGRAYEDGSMRKVVRLLNSHRPEPGERDLRGFEWYYWWRASHLDVRRYRDSTAPFHAIAAPTDGAWVAALGWPKTVRVFDRARMRPIHSVDVTTEPVFAGLSSDGTTLAAAGGDDRIRLIETSGWTRIRDLELPGRSWNRTTFSPTSGIMASAPSEGATLTLWDTDTWESADFPLDDVSVGSNLAFSPDGSTLALGSAVESFAVVLWDIAARRTTKRLLGHEEGVKSVAWSPDGRLLASGSSDETIRLWSAGDLETAGVLSALGPVEFLSFSPDSAYLAASVSKGNAVRVWNTETNELLCTIRGHRQPVGALAFVGDATTLWTVSQDGYIKVWDIHRADRTETVTPDPGEGAPSLLGVTSASAGSSLLTHRPGHAAQRWELDGRVPSTPRSGDEKYDLAALSDDGRLMAAYTFDGRIRVTDLESGRPTAERRIEPPLEGDASQLVVSRDGRIVVLAVFAERGSREWSSGQVLSYDLERGEQRREDVPTLQGVSISADGKRLAVQRIFDVDLADVDRAELLTSFAEVGPARSMAFSPDGAILAVGYWDNNVYLYSVRTYERVRLLDGHSREVTSLAFSPDSATLVSGGKDSTLRIWSVGSGQLLSTLTGHRGTVDRVAFAPDGLSILSTASEDDGIKIWRRATDSEVVQDTRDAAEIISTVDRTYESHVRMRQALLMLNDAVEISPDEPQLLKLRGDALSKLGRPLEALSDYRRALELGLQEAAALDRVAEWSGLRPWPSDSGRDGATWRYTEEQPEGEGWKTTDFDDSVWQIGEGPFGTAEQPTRWTARDIWLRREFELENAPGRPPVFLLSVDDEAEIFLNGVLANRELALLADNYRRLYCAESAFRALRRGRNVLAVHCRNKRGEGRIDVRLTMPSPDDAGIALLTRLIGEGHASAEVLAARAQAYMRRGDWKAARGDFYALTELDTAPDTAWHRAVVLFAHDGDVTRSRQLAQAMLRRYSDTERANEAEKTAKLCLLVDLPAADLDVVTRLARRSNTIAREDPLQAWVLPWTELVVGWAELRNGNHRDAIAWCEKALAHDGVPYREAQARFILAMCHALENDRDAARRAWAEGERILAGHGDPALWGDASDWPDWVTCALMRDEARALLEAGTPQTSRDAPEER